jgi:hypothetical protein
MLSPKHFFAVLAFLVASSSASPSGAVSISGIIYWTYLDTAYTPITDISFAGGSGQLLTQILGNPFSLPQEQFDKAVTDAMYGAHFGPATHFTTTPIGGYGQRPFYVRLVFGSSYPISINTICIVPPEAPRIGANHGEVRVSAAFCQEGRVLTYLEGGGSDYTGADDPRFAAFIRNVTFNLFPPNNPNNPNHRDGHEQRFPNRMFFRHPH